jgi:hypothetical protein
VHLLEHFDRASDAFIAGSFWFAVVAHRGRITVGGANSLAGEFGAVFFLEAAT